MTTVTIVTTEIPPYVLKKGAIVWGLRLKESDLQRKEIASNYILFTSERSNYILFAREYVIHAWDGWDHKSYRIVASKDIAVVVLEREGSTYLKEAQRSLHPALGWSEGLHTNPQPNGLD